MFTPQHRLDKASDAPDYLHTNDRSRISVERGKRQGMLHRPQSTAEALALLAGGEGTPIAGGTDIYPALVDRPPPAALIDLSRLGDLKGVTSDSSTLRIGAATTWSEIAKSALPPAFDMLRQAARQIGAVQIQNRATIGGNLCNASPAADGAPPLLALDAEVELASPRGSRRMPLEQFTLGNRRTARAVDEIMTAVIMPQQPATARSTFLKLGARDYLVISIVMVAALLDIDRNNTIRAARIAIGAASPTAQRLRDLEARLIGRPADARIADDLSPADFAALNPIDDVRATAAYRLEAAHELVRRALLELAGVAYV